MNWMLCSRFAFSVSAAVTMLMASAGTFAQDYPSRPVKIIVASVPGSAPDTLARIIGENLRPLLGQAVVIENKAGAGGVVGIDNVAKAAPDGYTLGIGHDGTMAINTTIFKTLPYDPAKDFAAIAPLALNQFVLIANPATGVKTFDDFVKFVKAKPDTAYASAGIGTPNHLFMEMLMKDAGISMLHVPYKGGAEAVTSILSGQVPFMLAGLAPALPHIQAGKLNAIAVTQPARATVLPDVPTVGETLKGFGMKTWFGLFAPAGIKPEIVERLNQAVRKVLAQKSVEEKITAQGMVVETGDPAMLADLVKSDLKRYRELAKEIKLEAN